MVQQLHRKTNRILNMSKAEALILSLSTPCLDKEISTVSLCLISQSLPLITLPLMSPPPRANISGRSKASKFFQSLSRCLFRWATADESIVWSAVPTSADHPAAAAMMTYRPRQEVGNRKKTGPNVLSIVTSEQ